MPGMVSQESGILPGFEKGDVFCLSVSLAMFGLLQQV